MRNLRETIGNAFAVMVLGLALLFVFGARILNGLVDFARYLGAN